MTAPTLWFGTGASAAKDREGLRAVLGAALDAGVRRFDTAPSYKTERILGRALRELAAERGLSRSDYLVQTKIDPLQMQDGRVRDLAEAAVDEMGVGYLDCLLVHWPVPEYVDATWEAFEGMRREGLARRIGVCNVRTRQLGRMLEEWDVAPEVVQIERNPLRTCEGEVALCAVRGIEVQAYSALCKMDPRIRDSEAVRAIAEAHGRSVGQVVLRWHLQTGVSPIFTSKRPERVAEYADVYGFELGADEVAAISALNEDYKMYLESCICPGF